MWLCPRIETPASSQHTKPASSPVSRLPTSWLEFEKMAGKDGKGEYATVDKAKVIEIN